ncbi:MAG: hypothetical protein D6696_19015 [Acidobacteria bacterium]|nr:MAG: hypothetical protein D6696_19015 [Acidobacteriota bacterium]
MHTVLVVPDGVGIRNFLCTDFVDRLRERGPVSVWHALDPATVGEHGAHLDRGVRWRPLPRFRESLGERVLRQAKVFAQLYWRYREDAGDVQLGVLRPRGRPAAVAVNLLARLLGALAARPRGLSWLERRHAAACRRARHFPRFAAELADLGPADVVFCTHQRASRAVPALAAARAAGIPTATFIYSWDNLPKGRMAVQADHFAVWSEAMRDELLSYYPEVDAGRVDVTGTPQFEPYFDPALRAPRQEVLGRLGLDPARPVICYSGDDVLTSPDDPTFLADLAQAVARLPAAERPQILFRRCPVDRSRRYDEVLARHPEIAVSDPAWRAAAGDWTAVVPTREDVALLAGIVHHCDLVVNVASTMALDFAILDKPAIWIAYDPPGRSRPHLDNLYRLPHFRCVHRLEPLYWARSREQLGDLVRRALRRPEERRAARRAWVAEIAHQPLDQASRRLAGALAAIAARRTP